MGWSKLLGLSSERLTGRDSGKPGRAPFAPTLALTVALALACFAALMAVVMAAVQPEEIRGLGTSQKQDAETALYVIGFAVILPLALIAVPRLADAVAGGPNAAALSPVAALLASGLAAAALLVRLSGVIQGGGGKAALLAAVLLWSLAAAALLWRCASARPWRLAAPLAGAAPLLWAAAGALAFGALLTVTDLDSVSPLALALGAVAVPAAVLVGERLGRFRLRGRLGAVADVAIVLLLALAVPDLVIITPEDPASTPLDRFEHGVIQFHHDFLLGPANQVLGGQAMLVDTASQYGVGSIYLLAGWFNVVPIGYGTSGLLDGVLTALYFAAGYCVLRLAGASRLLAAAALVVGLIALVLNRHYPVGALPQEGPLRFGLPLALILATVAAERLPRRSALLHACGLGVLAIASIWALEAFALTAATFVALACFRAWLLPPGVRSRWLVRQAALAVAACLGAHLLFTAATLLGSGELPDWGQYLAFLDAFLLGELGNLTYDFARWSPALAVGAGYLASAAALVLLARRRPDVAGGERVALMAIAGTTAYGISLFNYFVDRSAAHVLPYVCLPLLLSAALWLALLVRLRPSVPRAAVRGALALSLGVAVLLTSVAWNSIEPRFENSALAHLAPGGGSPGDALDRLVDFPALNPNAVAGERLLERYLPGERRSVVLAQPNVATETLIRSERANRLPLADPWEDSFVADERTAALRDAVAQLQPGDRALLDLGMLAELEALRERAGGDPLRPSAPGSPSAPVQRFALNEMDKRFTLRTVHRSGEGFVVVELERR
jgi:hypothetical protein